MHTVIYRAAYAIACVEAAISAHDYWTNPVVMWTLVAAWIVTGAQAVMRGCP